MNIVREIVKQVGEHSERTFEDNFVFEDINVSKELLDYHIIIMKEGGILEGSYQFAEGEIHFYSLYLGWRGNDFYETFKDDNVWKGAKSFVKGKGLEIAHMPFDILMELGKKMIIG